MLEIFFRVAKREISLIIVHYYLITYSSLKLSIDVHCLRFPRGAHLLVHPYCTLYSSLKNPYMQQP